MEYHIVIDRRHRIASFVNESDRDFCLDALAEYYDDCEFTAEEGNDGG